MASLAMLLSTEQVQAFGGKLWKHTKPRSYKKGETLDIKVGQLYSRRVATEPYDFYSLNWCDSVGGHEYDGEKIDNKEVWA